MFYRYRAGAICRFSRPRAFFRHRTLTDAFAARFKLVIAGLNRIIAVAAGASDIVIRLFDNAPADGGKNRDDKPGQRVLGGHHGQDIQQWDDRRDELGKGGVGDIDDVGNSARALLRRAGEMCGILAVNVEVFLHAAQVLPHGALSNLGIILLQIAR